MREAIGGTWLFQIVIVFIILFTGFMCLSINRSKAFNMKNKILETIQAYNGINLSGNHEDDRAMQDILSFANEYFYRTTGTQPDAEEINGEQVLYSCFDRNGNENNRSAIFCIARVPVKQIFEEKGMGVREFPEIAYYRIKVFYQLDLPIFHDLFNFTITGDTKTLYGGVITS